MKRGTRKAIAVLIPLAVIAILWILFLRHVDFGWIKASTSRAQHFAEAHIFLAGIALLAIHAVGMFFTLPTKAVFTMVSGALLGFFPAAAITMLGTLIGTTGLFFTTQKIVQEDVLARLPHALKRFESRLLKRPMLTVAGLRLILALPYGAITIFCAVVRIPVRAFLIGSVVGDVPVVALYSAAGLKLARIASTGDALSGQSVAILSIAAAGIFAGVLLPRKHNKKESS